MLLLQIVVYNFNIIVANVNAAMADELELWASKQKLIFSSKYHWVRCSCHIINLAVNRNSIIIYRITKIV